MKLVIILGARAQFVKGCDRSKSARAVPMGFDVLGKATMAIATRISGE